MEKKMNNKGFSLVELIIVIAIMAVLVGILAPQLLRYVERSRLQRDNSAIAEIANAAKIAEADETVNALGTQTIAPSSGTYSFSAAGNAFQKEMASNVGTSIKLSSNTYTATGATAPTITVTVGTGGVVTVSASNYKENPDATAAAKTF